MAEIHRCSSWYLRSCKGCEDRDGCEDYTEPVEKDCFFAGMRFSRDDEDDYE